MPRAIERGTGTNAPLRSLRRIAALTVALVLGSTAVGAPGLLAPASAAAPPLLVLGDSLCVAAARHGGDLEDRLRAAGWDPEVVCQIGEPLAWGIERVRERASVPSTVVVALGTNPGPSTAGFGPRVDTMLAELEARGATDIVWMTFADREHRYEPKSRIIRDVASRSPVDALRAADWAPVVRPNPEWFAADGLHYADEGKRQWASFLASQLSGTQAAPPFASVKDLIDRQYRDLLERRPDRAGAANWEQELRSGAITRDEFVAELVSSREFAGRIAPIARLYQAALGRDPDPAGARHWARAALPLPELARHIVTSAEFEARYGQLDDAAFVAQLYRNALGREPDPAGAADWERRLATGASRAAVVLGFSESPELVERSKPRIQALMLYLGLLNRAPDPQGLQFWEARLRDDVALASIVGGFLDSDEYRQRLEALGIRTVSAR